MSLGFVPLLSAIADHARRIGFMNVYPYEPKAAPAQDGIAIAFWADTIRHARSGLASTSALVVLAGRVYLDCQGVPEDDADRQVVDAVDQLWTAYAGDFELGGTVRAIDLRGMEGVPLSAKLGWLEQDQRLFRIASLVVPVIVNDAWTETP